MYFMQTDQYDMKESVYPVNNRKSRTGVSI